MTDTLSVTEQMFGIGPAVHEVVFTTEQLAGKRSTTMDRRVRKTRDAIYSAFVALVVQKGYERLSVQDIIEEADVGRTTFYAHFKTKDELLRFGFIRLRDHLGLLPRATPHERAAFLEALLRHAKAHAGLFLALSQGGGGRLAEAEFAGIVDDILADDLGGGRIDATMLVMLRGALLASIRRWIDAGAPGSGSEITGAFNVLVAGASR